MIIRYLVFLPFGGGIAPVWFISCFVSCSFLSIFRCVTHRLKEERFSNDLIYNNLFLWRGVKINKKCYWGWPSWTGENPTGKPVLIVSLPIYHILGKYPFLNITNGPAVPMPPFADCDMSVRLVIMIGWHIWEERWSWGLS